MRRQYRFARSFLFLQLAGLLMAGMCADAAQQIAAFKPVSSSDQVKLRRMLLLLQPGPSQQSDLDALLTAQTTPGNPRFHRWLTPQQFAERYALSQASAGRVVAWLTSQGFVVAPLPYSRGWVEFSGTVSQVQRAFHRKLESIPSSGSEQRLRYKFSGPAQIPPAIAAMVKGLVSLDGISPEPASTAPIPLESLSEAMGSQAFTQDGTLTPGSATPWLHNVPIVEQGIDGAGETIAIPSRSNIREEDLTAFRYRLNLPGGDFEVHPAGPDPGLDADQAATLLAASWAGASAPGARILLVPAASTNATDGVDLALAATIDEALAHVVTVGYSACEPALSEVHLAFYAALYRQASAEGISVIVASGDHGAAACAASPVLNRGLAVNGLASTPWNTSVGAASLDAVSGNATAWNTTTSRHDPARSAYATGGGASRVYPTPAWQAAQGTSSLMERHGPMRLLPDLSLPAFSAAGGSLPLCYSGSSADAACRLFTSAGSAASSAMLAGAVALLNQKYGPQGNLAPSLYALSRAESLDTSLVARKDAFPDVTSGTAELPCATPGPDCTFAGLIGYRAAAGYDLASGLGSLNVQDLVEDWPRVLATGTAPVVVEMTTIGGITYNPSAQIALTAKVISGSGGTVPTGTVQFYDETSSANTGSPVTLAADGTATYTENGQFSTGGHNIAAIYSGDSIYASGQSQPVTINIQPSATSLKVTPSTTTPGGGSTITVTGVVTATNPGAVAPTGVLTVNLDGLPQGTAKLATTGASTSASVTVTVPSGGAHTVQGTYSGDSNYNNSTSPSVTITVAKSATVTTVSATPSTITTGTPETLTATVAPATPVTGTTYTLSGTVSFYDGATLLGTVPVTSNAATLTGVSLSASATHSITAAYSGDTTYSASTSAALVLQAVLQPVTVVLSASSGVLAPGQSVTLTATVTPVNPPPITAEQHPSGFVLFYAGNALIGSQAPVLVGPGYSGVASTFVSHLPAGTYVLTAIYSGDPTYGQATSNSLNLQAEDFTISCNLTNLTIKQGATSTADVTCAVASLGGLTGPIQVVCEEQNPPQTGAIQCSLTPTVINGTGNATLTVVTVAGFTADARPVNGRDPSLPGRDGPPLWPVSGGAVLACLGLLTTPTGRKSKLFRGSFGKLLMLALLIGGISAVGCNNTTSLISNKVGTPLGQHTLKITAAADVNTVTVSHSAYLTVNVTP